MFFDVLVGINLLREGLDIPEITLVAILDADKEGFLRSEVSLIQTIGRAAPQQRRTCDHVRRRDDGFHEETPSGKQSGGAPSRKHIIRNTGSLPPPSKKSVRDLIAVSKAVAETEVKLQKDPESMNRKELMKLIKDVEKQMRQAAADLNFEQAAELRDKMLDLKKSLEEMDSD